MKLTKKTGEQSGFHSLYIMFQIWKLYKNISY